MKEPFVELEFESEYVVGAYGTAYRAIEVFRTGEMQGAHNERLRIIKLLEDSLDYSEIDCCLFWQKGVPIAKGEETQVTKEELISLIKGKRAGLNPSYIAFDEHRGEGK